MTTAYSGAGTDQGAFARGPQYLLGFVLVVGYLLAAATAVATFTWPLADDQGVFSWAGDVIVRGGMPYRDAWEVKGPLGLYIFAMIETVCGVNPWAFRVFDQLVTLATIFLTYRMVSRISDRTTGLIGALVLWFLLLRPGWNLTAQPDTWAGMLVFAALSVVVSTSTARRSLAVAAGGLVGLACLNKFFFAAFLLPLCYYEWRDVSATRRQVAARIVLMVGSCATVFALQLLWLWWRGALADFLDIQIDFNAVVHWAMLSTTFSEWSGMRGGLLDRSLLLVWPLALLGFFSVPSEHRRLKVTLALTILVGMGLFFVQRKYYRYHLTPIYPELIVFAACGLHRLRRGWSLPNERSPSEIGIRGVLTAVAVAALVAPCLRQSWNAWRFLAGTLSRAEYYDASFPTARVSASTGLAVIDYLKSHTKPDDSVLVWGIQSEVNYLSQRRSPTRFGIIYPLVVKPDAPICQRYRQEFMRDLTKQPPAYVVVFNRDECERLVDRTSKQLFEEFAALSDFVKQRYVLEESQPKYDLWRLQATP